MEEVYLPTEVDSPMMVLFWSSKEVGLVMVCIFGGFLLKSLMLGVGLAYLFIKFLNKYETGNLEGTSLAELYWLGVWNYKELPDSFKRIFM